MIRSNDTLGGSWLTSPPQSWYQIEHAVQGRTSRKVFWEEEHEVQGRTSRKVFWEEDVKKLAKLVDKPELAPPHSRLPELASLLLNYVFLWLETWMDYSTLMSSVQEYRWNPSKDRRNEWWSLEQKVTFFFKIFLNTMGFMGGLSGVFSCIIIRGEDWTLITKNNN